MVALSPVEAQKVAPVGAEFQVNTYTQQFQHEPAIASDGDGDFVVVWTGEQRRLDWRHLRPALQLCRRSRSPSSSRSTPTPPEQQNRPAVAAAADGRFVVAWQSFLQEGGVIGVFARRFSSDGTPQAVEFQVNTVTVDEQDAPAVAAADDGGFVIAWASNSQDGFGHGVFARRFDSAGSALGVEFQVNTYTQAAQFHIAASAAPDGDFVVAWQSYYQDGNYAGVFARRFDSAGSPQATEFQVNSSTAGSRGSSQRSPTAMTADSSSRGPASRWRTSTTETSPPAASTPPARRRATSSRSTRSLPHGRNDPGSRSTARATSMVVWQGNGPFGVEEVFARNFDSAGGPKGGDFQVNSTFAGRQSYPVVASTGSFVVAWASAANPGQDGSGSGIFARRVDLSALPALDLDGDGTLGPLTDGLLFLRLLFGFSGTTLTTGAVGGGCTRCDADSITAHVAGHGFALDIDGDAALAPLSDGLLVLRYLFGFSGTTLTAGAVASGCSRCDAAAIVPYLQTLD